MKRLLLLLMILLLPLLMGATYEIDGITIDVPDDFEHGFDFPWFAFPTMHFIGALVLGVILIALFKEKMASFAKNGKERFFPNMGLGLAWLILIPLIGVISAITIIGIPFAIVLFILYVILIVFSAYMSAFILGHLIVPVDTRSSFGKMFLSLLVGALLLSLLNFIPIIGWLIGFLIFLVSYGTLFRMSWRRIR